MPYFVLFFIALFALESFATPNRVMRRDLKLASQQLIEKQSWAAPELGDADQMLAAQATSNTVTTTVSSGFLAQPDVCRNVVITPGGTTASVPAGDITVTGTNYYGATITETFTLTENQSTADVGTKAFCSITSVVFPIQDGAGATYDVGTGALLGLKHCMDGDHVLFATHSAAYEATRPTVAADADEVEKNTISLNTALDGSAIEAFFIQNFRCL
jgi:hypothetical protein